MKIQIASDLHTEFGPVVLAATDADVIVLAGDIGIGVAAIEWAADLSQRHGKPVVFVAGNHEFYHGEYTSTLDAMRRLALARSVVFLENDTWVSGGVRFLGATFWTDYAVNVQTPPDLARWIAGKSLADHDVIRFKGRRFLPDDAYHLHRQSVAWLENQLSSRAAERTVVVTHHGPSRLCEHPGFGMNDIAPCFYSDRADLVRQADLWIFGHTHANLDIDLKSRRIDPKPGRLVSNQKGYPGERVPGGFDPGLVIKV